MTPEKLTACLKGPQGIGIRIGKEYMAPLADSRTNYGTSVQQYGVETGNDSVEWYGKSQLCRDHRLFRIIACVSQQSRDTMLTVSGAYVSRAWSSFAK